MIDHGLAVDWIILDLGGNAREGVGRAALGSANAYSGDRARVSG